MNPKHIRECDYNFDAGDNCFNQTVQKLDDPVVGR